MNKLRITPIGTCRIHTPLKRASARHPIEIDLRRNYGFVHTSDEALQLLRFLQGDKEFRPEVAPLVLRGDPADYSSERWEPSDQHIVEISSAKRITCGPDVVQSNYVQRHFSDFFASDERSRIFWNLVRKGHRQDLLDFLRNQQSYRMLDAENRHLLASLSVEQQSYKAILSDMDEIAERLGRDRLLFITHVNAVTPEGARIPTRDRVIRWVKMAASQLQAKVFDPTAVMEEFGQQRALENEGLDLTHYTLPFSDRLYDAIHQTHIAGSLNAQAIASGLSEEEQEQANRAAQLEAALEFGDFFAASRQVHDALAQSPDALHFIELRGIIRSRIGDLDGAVGDLSHRADPAMLSHAKRIALLMALEGSGKCKEALEIAEDLIGEEFENAVIYRSAASAAERSGQAEKAVRYSKQAFRSDRSDLSTALRALLLIRKHGDQAEAEEWRRELLENIGTASSGGFELAKWAAENSDDQLFAAALEVVAGSDKVSTIELTEEAANAGMTHALSEAIPIMARLGRLPPALALRRNAIITRVVNQVAGLLESDCPVEAFELSRALARLREFRTSQIAGVRLGEKADRLLVQATRHVRKAVRNAYDTGDPQRVVDAAEGADAILLNDPDSAVIVARSLYALDRCEEAYVLMKNAQAANPDSINARRWTGRLAAIEFDYATALDMYGSLKENPTTMVEVERFFATVERRALKQLRKLVDDERYDQALQLASAIETHLGPLERTGRELNRMHSRLRQKLRAIDEGEAEMDDREKILRTLIRARPDDQRMLRRAALEFMRQFRFAEAAEYWDRLHQLDPNNESAHRNRVRCATLADRRASVSVTVADEMA